MNNLKKQIINESHQDKVYLLTGITVAIDKEDGILIAGMFSDSPFIEKQSEKNENQNLVGSFAFTRQKARFLRERLDEFLQG